MPQPSQRALRPRVLSLSAAGVAVLVVGSTALSAVQASAEVPSGWTEAARDSYARAGSGSWGRADVGGAYTHEGAHVGLGTAGGIAYTKLTAGQGLTSTLKSVSVREANVSDTFTIATGPSTADLMHGWWVRVQGDGSAYTARVRKEGNNRLTLGISRRNGSASTWLAGITLPFTYAPGTQIRGELQVTGTSPALVQARAWKAGGSVPAWQVIHQDNDARRIQLAGAVANWTYLQSGAGVTAVNSDNLALGAASAGAPTTPPPTTPPPTTTPPPIVPAPAPTGSRGSVAVGSANYGVPAGAIFVDVNRGSDSNAGALASPMKTLKAAVTKIPSGGARTFVLRGGVYHESVTVDASRSATVQNYPGEAVWFDGSVPLTGWTQSGTRWIYRGWKAEFSSMMGADQAFKDWFLNQNRMAANPDLLFIDGTQQAQVATVGEVVGGKFHVDYGTDTVTIGTNPAGKEVRASDLRQALFLSGKNSVVQGVGVRRYANGYEVKGAVRVINTGGIVRNVIVNDVATFGVTVSGSNKTIDRVTIQRAGMTGLGGHLADNSTVTNSVLSSNNHERFKDAPEAGGMKFTASRTMVVNNNEANNNVGASGIWFDVSSHNVKVVNNTANGNSKYGIAIEISGHGIVANNQAVGGEAGIILFNTNDWKVFNNEVGSNTLFGIKLAQDERRQSQLGSFPYARDPRVTTVDPTVTWLNQNIQLSNNVFGLGNRNNSHIYALDGRTRRAVDTWNVTINGNLFNAKKVASTDATMVAWGKGDNVTLERYETPAALAAAKNTGWKNAQLTTFKTLSAMSGDKSTYAATAVPIPADVAAATGRLTQGERVLGVK